MSEATSGRLLVIVLCDIREERLTSAVNVGGTVEGIEDRNVTGIECGLGMDGLFFLLGGENAQFSGKTECILEDVVRENIQL